MHPLQLPTPPVETVVDETTRGLQHVGIVLTPAMREYLTAAAVLLGFLLLAVLLRWVLRGVLLRLAARANSTRGDRAVRSVSWSVFSYLLAVGVISALLTLSLPAAMQSILLRGYGVLTILLGIVMALQASALLIDVIFRHMTHDMGETTTHYAALSRKIVGGLIWLLGSMVVLAQLGIAITPLLTTLGIGSLAIALALQDTLSNFFAAVYLMLDRPIKVGDYVRLENGSEGFVDAIGWRSTRIRLWSNYIIVIPNSQLTSSSITNLVLNHSETAVYIHAGVGYLNDLDHVEQVVLEVAHEVAARMDGACTATMPLVRFQEFGESNINFMVILQVRDFSFQYLVKHEFIKALHRRFRAEKIEIAWPVRQLIAPHPIPVTQVPAPVETGQTTPV